MMKIVKKICSNKHNIFFIIFGLILTISYTSNLFRISDVHLFHGFERQPEGLVIGRLVRAQSDGIFSYGGLTGINYNNTDSLNEQRYSEYQAAQHDYFITNKEIPNSFFAYKSQSGGQAILMAVLAKSIPIPNLYKLMLFRLINALLITSIFILFSRWVHRNFGFIAAIITLVLIGFSPWLNVYSHSLWWVLWNFYLPFIITLLICETYFSKQKRIIGKWLILGLFLAVFFKCCFSGFEFITTSLLAGFVPFVYYSYLSKIKLFIFLKYSILLGTTMLFGVITQMLLLVIQIKAYMGSFDDGVSHIIVSFTKRTATEIVSLWDVIKIYLLDDSFSLGFLPNNYSFFFGLLILIFFLAIPLIYFQKQNDRKIKALIVSFIFSFTAPLSWLIIFKQHAWIHLHMDYIVWYMPTFLYGFIIIGVLLNNLIGTRLKN